MMDSTGLSNALATSRLRLRLRLRLTFSAVLLCDLFDNHLRSLPTVPAPLALPPHFLQLLEQ